jgi:hypothetical protein
MLANTELCSKTTLIGGVTTIGLQTQVGFSQLRSKTLIQEEEIEYPALDEEEESAEKTEPGEGECAGIPP